MLQDYVVGVGKVLTYSYAGRGQRQAGLLGCFFNLVVVVVAVASEKSHFLPNGTCKRKGH